MYMSVWNERHIMSLRKFLEHGEVVRKYGQFATYSNMLLKQFAL